MSRFSWRLWRRGRDVMEPFVDVMEPFVYKNLGEEVPRDAVFVIVHHSVKILPPRVFYDCRQLKEVTLPEGLEEIGESAFQGCVSLERINYPSSLIKIDIRAFMGCRSLKEVQLPEGLEEIGQAVHHSVKILPPRVINRCQLKEVTLPEGLKEIGDIAFSYCVLLEQINCPSTLIKIDISAFSGCRSLRKVTLAGGVVTIKGDSFQSFCPLEGVTIPSKAFVLEVDYVVGSDNEVFTCRLVLPDDGTVAFTEAEQVIISPERLNYISSPYLLELQLENATTTIMNDRGHTREENIERVLALIKSHALYEVSTILELALWKNKMQETDDSGSRGECRVMCGSDDIIPGVLSYL